MRLPRNRFDRSEQVFRWALDQWNFGAHPVTLRWMDRIPGDRESPEGYAGYVQGYEGDPSCELEIVLCQASNPQIHIVVDTLIHELTHALLWDVGLGYCHGPNFWPVFGEMRDAYDQHGITDSRAYGFKD